MILVLIGVTGNGKSTIAHELVERTGWLFAEGDDFHSEANKAKMHAGTPLTDEDRAPWLHTLHGVLEGWQTQGQNGIMTCSALKRSYRDILGAGIASLHFVLLAVPREVLVDRLAHRTGHFMNPSLLHSQLATLELSPDLVRVDANRAPGVVAQDILRTLGIPGRAL